MKKEKIVLAIDVGSSSIRCSPYRIDNNSNLVGVLEDCCVKQEARTIQPNTGRILNLTHDNSGDDNDNQQVTLFDHIDACVDETLKLLRQRSKNLNLLFEVAGVGFSTFVMNLVGVDHEGQVIGEVASMSYACNSPEASEYCQKLKDELDQEMLDSLYLLTGAPLHSAYAPVQLGAFYSNPEHEDLCLNQIASWQTIASFCLARWMGVSPSCLPISWCEASWTGLFNFSTCRYEPMALKLLPESCQKALPNVANFDGSGGNDENNNNATTFQRLCRGIQKTRDENGDPNPYWDRWPELRGSSSEEEEDAKDEEAPGENCRLFLGGGDGACANLGSKCTTASRIAVTVGTSAAARVCLPLPVLSCDHANTATIADLFKVPPGLFCYRINQSYVLLGGALTDGGSVVEWVSSLTNITTTQALEDCMTQVNQLLRTAYTDDNLSDQAAAAVSHLTVVPFLSGERSTGFRHGATGAMLGLTRDTTAAHLFKAGLEGVTLRINAILRLIQSVILSNNSNITKESIQIVASGKALEVNKVWRQMLADCSGLNVVWDEDIQESTSRGVALLVATALSNSPSTTASVLHQEILSSDHVSKPNLTATHGYWRHATEAQEQLIDALTPLFHA